MSFRLLAILSLAVVTAAEPSTADEFSELETVIVDGWRSRQEAFDSVYWRIEGTRLYPRGSCSVAAVEPGEIPDRDYPAEDHEFPLVCEVWIDFKNNRIRHEFVGEIFHSDYDEFLPAHRVHLCDGLNIQNYLPMAGNPRPGVEHRVELYERTGNNVMFFNHAIRPVLKAHGLVHDVRPLPFLEPPAMGDFQVDDEYIDPQGRRMIVLRREQGTGLVDERHVAVDQSSAICEQSTYYNGKLMGRYQVQYEEMDPVAMPVEWTLIKESDGQLMQRDELRVVEFVANPALGDIAFHMTASSGTMVFHEETGKAVFKRVPGQPDVPLGEFLPAQQETDTHLWRLWFLLTACLFALTAWLAFRSRRRANTGTSSSTTPCPVTPLPKEDIE